jgi:uncharacterized protein (DUF885 family)
LLQRAAFPAACGILSILLLAASSLSAASATHEDLVRLFDEWRAFEQPILHDGVPDYTSATIAAKGEGLKAFRERLDALDTTGWSMAERNDLKLVQSEMNGLDFNIRILRPWARDPAFYVSVWAARSDCPLREGPLAWPAIELYTYKFPLSPADQHQLAARLSAVPVLLKQARQNLKDSNARDLWIWSEGELGNQSQILDSFAAGTLTVSTLEGSQHATLDHAAPELAAAVSAARTATEEFVQWLRQLAPTKTGPSGVGKENYDWYQKNVHLVPFTWDEQVVLLRRELERAQASLRLEEHNNRNLPPLNPAPDAAAFEKLNRQHLDKFVSFLITQQIIPDKPYIKAALEPQLGPYLPEDKRIFFTRVTHREPMLLLSHCYHWIDLARMRDEPNPDPVRRPALLSNIWDTRAEGFATAFEEIVMHAGLYDDNPRAKELVWIMLANRAARGLASLYVQANQLTLEQAGKLHSEWTPRGWAVANDSLTAFEQLLYLRQPGYGASYIVGKLEFDRLLTEYAHQQDQSGQPFVLRDFIDRFNNEGIIPIPLMEEELVPTAAAREP